VDLEWDPKKAAANRVKHGIDFADAATALHDELAITVLDDHSGEARFVSEGADALGRVVVVVFTWRNHRVRLISARRANSVERGRYEEKR
jgi:uncharacterized DUF497 family protein